MTVANEDLRAEMLLDAQDKAAQLFAEIERRGRVRAGRVCRWILEVCLIDPERRFGGFYDELLDVA